jgi:hypothetical protein
MMTLNELKSLANRIKEPIIDRPKIVVLIGSMFGSGGLPHFCRLWKYNIPYPSPEFLEAYLEEMIHTHYHSPTFAHHFIRLLYEKNVLSCVYSLNMDGLEYLADVPSSKIVQWYGGIQYHGLIETNAIEEQNTVNENQMNDQPQNENNEPTNLSQPSPPQPQGQQTKTSPAIHIPGHELIHTETNEFKQSNHPTQHENDLFPLTHHNPNKLKRQQLLNHLMECDLIVNLGVKLSHPVYKLIRNGLNSITPIGLNIPIYNFPLESQRLCFETIHSLCIELNWFEDFEVLMKLGYHPSRSLFV